MSATIQVVIAQLKNIEHRDRFIELTKEMVSWLRMQPGFVEYSLYENEIDASDALAFESDEAAERINKNF